MESCKEASEKINGKQVTGYHVILKDTVLFPEGGGQVTRSTLLTALVSYVLSYYYYILQQVLGYQAIIPEEW